LSKRHCRTHPFHKKQERMVTLADLYCGVEDDSAPGWAVVSVGNKKDLLITLRRIAEMLDYPMELIEIDEIAGTEFNSQLFDYVLERGVLRKGAVRYCCMRDRLLLFAHAGGWLGTPEYLLDRSWDVVRAALKGGYGGCSDIVAFAIRRGKAPNDLTEQDLQEWAQEMLDKKRSLGTITIAERCFRLQLRRAGLQPLFKLNLASRNPSQYHLPLDQMAEELRQEILAVIHWKTSRKRIKGRKAKFRIRPITARRLLEVLTQLCGYAATIFGLKNIKSLRQIFGRRDILCGFADFLLVDRK